MTALFFVLVAIGGIVALWLIFKLLGGCLLRVLLTLGVLAVIGFIVFFLLTR